jgi:hypothetical protein
MIENNGQPQAEPQGSPAPEGAEQTASQILDLDGVSQFKFQGRELTPDQLGEIFQGYQKYGETSKYVNEDQTFWANVNVDIDKVLKNPARAEEFKRTYPERFHALLDRAMKSTPATSETSQVNQTQNALPKDVLDRLSKVDLMEQRLHQADVQAASAQIDAILPKLLEKYELADEDKVLSKVEAHLNRGLKLSPAVWERFAREDHERVQKRADKVYEAKLKNQINKGREGQDIGAGGATPGQAPNKPKTFEEAQKAMIASMRSQRA